MNKLEKIIEVIELDYLEYVQGDIEKRKLLLPIKNKEQIKNLIWNLMVCEKYRKQISKKDYSDILDIWFSRIK